MATPSTLNCGDPTPERSVDEGYVSVQPDMRLQSGDDKTVPVRPHITDFFAYSSLSDDVVQFQHEIPPPLIGNFEEESDDEATSSNIGKVGRFFRLFPKRTIYATDVCFKITPAIGAVCYEYFSLSVMDPVWFCSAFGESVNVVKNIFWCHAHLGCGLYIFSRQHIRKVSALKAIFYSMFGSLIFNFGSLLCWGWGRQMLPESPLMRTSFGLLSGGALLYAAQDYLQYVDSTCSEVD